MPISGKELRKLFYDAGYELVTGGGKGSHWKLRRRGAPTVISALQYFWTKMLREAKSSVMNFTGRVFLSFRRNSSSWMKHLSAGEFKNIAKSR